MRIKRPKDVRQNPITHPALYATQKALSREIYAVWATFVLEKVAICIPIYPEIIDVTAPTIKATVV